MPYDVTLIPGDGIGPEVTSATVRVLEATGVAFNWDTQDAGEGVMAKYGTPLPEHVIESIKKNGIALKGPITTPVGTGFRSVNVALRQTLDLYACLRPCKTYDGVPSRYSDVDLIVVRENTEGLYCGIEFEKGTAELDKLIALVKENEGKELDKNSGVSLKVISEHASRRIVKFAFEYARKNGRKKVTAVHKANILKYSDGLFLSIANEIAAGYPDIEYDDVIIDNMCMQLVRNPEKYDVMVLPNLFGDIASDLCAGLVGGLGVAPGANIGEGYAVFEPTHGSAPKYAGLNKTNPMATMLSGVLMLRHLGHIDEADRMEKALADIIAEGKSVTYDLKSDREDTTAVGTSEVADAIIEKMISLK
ncbi:MAG: isocitrate/isopropylmalate dehydrogenase family protein [Chloroflexi bacterium]|nr:isocitrate/isopropylmalate dehydrogenase family protein [Chloroflexota bacterium]MBT7081464.1 isocitrate/isopropylmalate dehydrogenase family protein [Chloroflexota bacterium]